MVVILVILTFVVCAVFYHLVQSRSQRKFRESLEIDEPDLSDYMFTPGHLWLSEISAGQFRIGLDELILRFIGEPDKIHLIEDGEPLKAGEPLAIICKGDKEIYIRAPGEATIVEANHYLAGKPHSINLDPYRRGWLYQVKLSNSGNNFGTLLSGDKAQPWIKREMARLKEFALKNQQAPVLAGKTLLDGGELIDGVVDHLDQTAVSEFEKQFLMNRFRDQDGKKK